MTGRLMWVSASPVLTSVSAVSQWSWAPLVQLRTTIPVWWGPINTLETMLMASQSTLTLLTPQPSSSMSMMWLITGQAGWWGRGWAICLMMMMRDVLTGKYSTLIGWYKTILISDWSVCPTAGMWVMEVTTGCKTQLSLFSANSQIVELYYCRPNKERNCYRRKQLSVQSEHAWSHHTDESALLCSSICSYLWLINCQLMFDLTAAFIRVDCELMCVSVSQLETGVSGLGSEWWSLITSSFHCQCHLPVQCLLCHADYIQIIDSILKTDISE